MNWNPPDDWPRITSIDAHTAGEPLRVITGGWPDLPGDTILERRRYQLENYDHLRRALVFEPRGHADMYGAIPVPPVTPEADIGVLFMHNEGYSTMCGHGIIALTKVALETGMLPVKGNPTTVKIDAPAGLITAHAKMDGDTVTSVAFENVPSFVLAADQSVDVPGIGALKFDVAFGGAFYAFCQAEDAGVGLTADDNRQLIQVGMDIKHAVMDAMPIPHPFEEDLSFLYGTIFLGPPEDAIGLDEPFTVESIIGSTFTGRILRTTKFGDYDAVVPEVEGTAHITGRNEWLIDPADPLRDGFILR
jgi:trans-L-3-hydroxyproline dehydratase